MKLPVFSAEDLTARSAEFKRPWHENYLAMYSSIWEGIVTDPVLMTVPVDDHLVHRADGVFDAFKCVNGRAYCLDRHLRRLERSASSLGIDMPPDYERITDIIKAVVRTGGSRDVICRIIVSRGPGSFSTNPFDCPTSQLYVIAHSLKPPPPEAYEKGVAIISAEVPVKPSFYAKVKSCDYLINVMITKAAKEGGVDFAVTWDENGFLAEGSTENILLVSPEKELLIPEFDRILQGITLTRVMELAEELVLEGYLKGVKVVRIDRATAAHCLEVMLCGTSLDVLPVRKWDGRTIGQGRPGPVFRKLNEVLRHDIESNPDLLTPMFE